MARRERNLNLDYVRADLLSKCKSDNCDKDCKKLCEDEEAIKAVHELRRTYWSEMSGPAQQKALMNIILMTRSNIKGYRATLHTILGYTVCR